jgi:tetratricopeptide (TPR) repeat protein
VWTLLPYARCLRLAGDVDGALRVLERARKVAEAAYGTTHLETARVIEGYGYHFYGLGNYEESLRYFERAHEVRKQVFGAGHLALGWNSYDRACVLARQGRRAAALGALREAVAVGWASDLIASDRDLASLRGDPDFEAIVEDVQSSPRLASRTK